MTSLLLTEVAAQLRVPLRTVRGWIASRELRAVDASSKPGSRKPRYRVRPEDLEAFVAARSTLPATVKTQRREKYTPKYFREE